jgi:excisionase family DNA binding protein
MLDSLGKSKVPANRASCRQSQRKEVTRTLEDVLYTVKEVSKLIKTNPSYVYSLINAGLLPTLKLGSYKVRRSTLLRFLERYEGKDVTDPKHITDLALGTGAEDQAG